jgi:gluconolactonase
VYATHDGTLWFTDPAVGYAPDIRPPTMLPAQVYCFMPNTTDLRDVADGFQSLNNITVSLDEKVCYISDTAGGRANVTQPRMIYTFDVLRKDGESFLCNRTTFAVAPKSIPDGMKVDRKGNLFVGAGDGIEVLVQVGG